MPENKAALRLAIAIHKQLSGDGPAETACELPESTWQRCDRQAYILRLAQRRGWSLAAGRCRRDLRAMIEMLQSELVAVVHQLDHRQRAGQPAATVQDIYRDLLALHCEFDQVSWDQRGKTLSATTEPIELEGVYLGPFRIELDWGDLVGGHPYNYRVIAVDENPAAINESVTHPHVQDESVCEGDGRTPIRKALEQGRLLDFFLIVRNLLQTYNSSSPYVALSEWQGVTCADCGNSTREDERWTCTKCESTVCEGCHYSCSDCGDAYCDECIDRCEGCNDHLCRCCLKQCTACRALCCTNCRDEQERCENCHEEHSNETNQSNSSAPLQPDRLGQAAVPA